LTNVGGLTAELNPAIRKLNIHPAALFTGQDLGLANRLMQSTSVEVNH
jgi:hypothetical protein